MTAAEEQLAEMRQVLEDIEWIDDTSYGPGCPFCWRARENGHDEECHLAKALSAAPKRGRVIWEGVGYLLHHGKDYPWTSIRISDTRPLEGHVAMNEQVITVTVREADLPTGPIDCPMCGVAGGDELGPCSMCKGAGFVEAEYGTQA